MFTNKIFIKTLFENKSAIIPHTMTFFTDQSQLQLFTLGFSFFSTALVIVILLTSGNKSKTVKSFILALIPILLWGMFGMITNFIKDEKLVMKLMIVTVMTTPLMVIGIINFAVNFYEGIKNKNTTLTQASKFIKAPLSSKIFLAYIPGILMELVLVSDMLGFSKLMVTGISMTKNMVSLPEAGILFPVIPLYFFAGILYMIYLTLLVKKGETKEVKTRVNWLMGSIILGLIAGGGLFPEGTGVPIPTFLSAFATPIFVSGTFYAITRHKLFNIKTVTTEIVVFGIWAFLLFRTVFANSHDEQIANMFLLISVFVFGTVLIRAMFKESSQYETLTKLTKKLENLNRTLEEKVAERTKKIAEANIHTETIIENLSVGLIEYDEDFRILRINNTAEKLFGVAREDVLNKKIHMHEYDPVYNSLLKVLHPKHIKKRKLGSIHTERLYYPQKTDIEVITTPIVYSQETKNIVYISLIRDVSQENRTKKMRNNFLSIAAHQLKTPLSGIKWILGLAMDGDLDKMKAERKKELLEQASTTNEQMISLINNFLDIAKIQGGYYKYNIIENDLVGVVEKICKLLQPAVREKGLKLNIKLSQTKLPKFAFDKEKIKSVIQNILENAISYTKRGGEVSLDIYRKNNRAVLEINDTGIGIAKEDMPYLFTKFFRSKKALETEINRSGIGLFVTKKIIEAHKGSIRIKSEEGLGTTVKITLPIKNKVQFK